MMAFVSRPQRTLYLPALAVAAGLLVAGVGLFHAVPRELTAVPPGYAALVNQKGILHKRLARPGGDGNREGLRRRHAAGAQPRYCAR